MYRYLLIFVSVSMIAFTSCNETGSEPANSDAASIMKDSTKFTSIKWQDSAIDFGAKAMGQIVNITYICTNTGNKPLYLFNVRPGCGCTLVDYTKQAIEPGNQGKIEAKFDTKKSHPGTVHKTVFVESNTKPSTFIYLAFTGAVMPADSTNKK